MATELNKFGINISGSTTVAIGRTSTVAEDGVAGLALKASVSCSFLTMANDGSANMNGPSGTNVSASQESQLQVTGYNASNRMMVIYNNNLDSGVVKLKVRQTEAGKKLMIQDSSASDIYISGGVTHLLDMEGASGGEVGLDCGGAVFIGINGEEANTGLDVGTNNLSIRGSQGINFYNGGQLFARAATLYAGTGSSDPWAGEKSGRYGIYLANGDIGGTSTSNAPTGTWYCSSIRNTTSGNIFRMTSGVCHITGEQTSANRFFELTDGNIYHSNGTISIDTDSASECQWDAASTDADNGPYNLIINHASNTTRIRSALEVLNNLTVTAGTFNTHSNDGSADKNLTVTKELSCAGIFTGNASLVTVGNILITAGTFTAPSDSGSGDLVITSEGNAGSGDGYAFRRTGGVFTHNSGTVNFTADHAPSNPTSIRMFGDSVGQRFNNVIINSSSGLSGDAGASRLLVALNDEGFYCEGDLTLTKGKMDMVGNRPVNVIGDVSIANGCVLGEIGTPWTNDNIELGSLTVASGGTYSAPSTTIIKSEVGTKCWDNQSGGTFTHNNGKVLFDSTIGDTTFDNAGADPFYDLEVKTNGDCKYLNAVTVENDLTLNHSNLSFGSYTDASGAITVLGTTRLVDGFGFSGGTDNLNDDYYGFLIVEGGNFRTPEGANAKRCRGIKQTGGTIT